MSNFLDTLEKYRQNLQKEIKLSSLRFETIKIGAEVLLSSISIDDNGAVVYPTNCPGKGRANDLLLDSKDQPACMLNGSKCPYFVSTKFTLEQYDKNIICSVV
jgi:hypothetical protein